MPSYLVFSDIHGQWAKLEELLAANLVYDQAIVCGDLVGNRNREEDARIVERLMEVPDLIAVAGNHDVWMKNGWLPEPLQTYVRDLRRVVEVDDPALGPLFVTHTPLRQLSKIYRSAALWEWLEDPYTEVLEIPSRCRLVLFGHTHDYFVGSIHGRVYLNPGGIGEGMLLDTDARQVGQIQGTGIVGWEVLPP